MFDFAGDGSGDPLQVPRAVDELLWVQSDPGDDNWYLCEGTTTTLGGGGDDGSVPDRALVVFAHAANSVWLQLTLLLLIPTSSQRLRGADDQGVSGVIPKNYGMPSVLDAPVRLVGGDVFYFNFFFLFFFW